VVMPKRKSEFIDKFEEYRMTLLAEGVHIRALLRSDNDGTYRDSALKAYCQSRGIVQVIGLPGQPGQPGPTRSDQGRPGGAGTTRAARAPRAAQDRPGRKVRAAQAHTWVTRAGDQGDQEGNGLPPSPVAGKKKKNV
jgi:hypothetical protein